MARGTFITLMLVFCLSLFGCCAEGESAAEVTQKAPAALTAEQRVDLALSRALPEWQAAVGWTPAVQAIRFDVPRSDDDRVAATWNPDSATLAVVPERIGDRQDHWDSVVMHELGHAFGAEHVDDPEAVMFPQAGFTTCVTARDAAEVARVLQAPVSPTCVH